MSKWMCDVKGRNPTSEENLEQQVTGGITHESLEKFIGNRGGIPENVQTFIRSLGYEWTDSGGGVDNWHLGVPFDSLVEASIYLDKITIKFKIAIANEFLRFELKTWSPKDWIEP